MVRVRGPAVTSLSLTFLEDWETETGEDLKDVEGECSGAHLPGPQGNTVVQVLPSGPAGQPHAIQGVLLQAIYLARRELILTTPYFVPDELLLTALASAAQRGVQVKLVVPAHVDSRLVRLASAAQRGDLASAGVSILEYGGGLLHTKSVTVDGELSLFGSLNLDPRSLNLNFEITLALYDRQFTSELVALQQTYLASCQPFDLAAWQRRSPLQRLLQDLCRLLSPLL